VLSDTTPLAGKMLRFNFLLRFSTYLATLSVRGATTNAFFMNACKGAKTDFERKSLLTCKVCASDTTAADDTYDHTFCSCQHPLLCQAQAESDDLLLTGPVLTDLNRRLFPVLLRLVQEVDGHRTCMGNWNSSQIVQLDQVLLSTDSVTALSESLLALSKHLVNKIDTLWAARQQAACHTALASTPEADPVTLRTLQRRCFKRRIITASAPAVFYAVRLGHISGIYTSWREAKPHSIGILSDVKRFSTRTKAEEYMSKSTGPGDPLLDDPSAFIFTDGSALPNGSAGWGVHITFPGIAETREIWGPVSASPKGRQFIGARRATSNTGELSAFYHALDWIRKRRKSFDPASSPRYNLVSDSFYCVKLFAIRVLNRLPTNILSLASMPSSTR